MRTVALHLIAERYVERVTVSNSPTPLAKSVTTHKVLPLRHTQRQRGTKRGREGQRETDRYTEGQR